MKDNTIKINGYLEELLQEYQEAYEKWAIEHKERTGGDTPMLDTKALIELAIRDEIQELKELMKEKKDTLDECEKAFKHHGQRVIVHDGKIIGYEWEKEYEWENVKVG